jgi:hypothetical protein
MVLFQSQKYKETAKIPFQNLEFHKAYKEERTYQNICEVN